MSTRPTAGQASQPRGVLATIVVLLIMVGIVGGGYVAQNAVASGPPRPVEISDGVTVTPPVEWEFAHRTEDGRTVLLSKGSASLAITVEPRTDAVAALTRLRDDWTTNYVTATDIEPLTNVRQGETVYRFAYSGVFAELAAPVEGEVTGAAGTSVTVVFDGWAGFGEYRSVGDEIETMIRDAVIP